MPGDEKGRNLRARLLAGDTTASNDVAIAYLDDLADWLEKQYYEQHPNDCLTAAQDAIVAFIKNPKSWRPDKKTLRGYLRMSADGDMKNLLEKERRHSEHRVNLELSESAVRL
jgi:hypothetical protein